MGRVVYVLRAFPEPWETFVRDEIRALSRLGEAVSVLAGWPSEPSAADWTDQDAAAVPVTILTQRRHFGLPAARLVGALVSDAAGGGPRHAARAMRLAALAQAAVPYLPPDATMLHAHFANDAAALARYVGRLAGLPYRLTAHAYDLYQDPFLLDANLASAARILTVSETNRAFLEERMRTRRLEGPPVEVVRCGIDLDAFAYRDPGAARRPARVLCAARLVAKKGHAVLFEALALLRAAGVDATLDVAGDGPLEAALRTRAARADLAGAVRLLGTLAHDAVRDAMRTSDLVVLASRVADDGDRDGIPVALMEAMALGVPVVSTRVSGIPELVAPGTGRLAPPGDAAALAEAIRATLESSRDALVAQARAARARVEAEFDLRAVAERLRA